MFVADCGDHTIRICTTDGQVLQTLGTAGRVLVADRENHRVEIFDEDGVDLDQWTGLLQPMDLFIDADDAVYVAEAQQRISVYSLDGQLLSRWGKKGGGAGQFSDSPHGLCVDSRGDLYVCEVIREGRLQKFSRV